MMNIMLANVRGFNEINVVRAYVDRRCTFEDQMDIGRLHLVYRVSTSVYADPSSRSTSVQT